MSSPIPSRPPESLTLRGLFDSDSDHYVIPIYQRPFAWGSAQIGTLLNDVFDYMPLTGIGMREVDYHLGTLVVWKQPDGTWEVVDGQQRLTTLFLVLCFLRWQELELGDLELAFISERSKSLRYECRQDAQRQIEEIALAESFSEARRIDSSIADRIFSGLECIETALSGIRGRCEDEEDRPGITFEQYIDYLLDHVRIVRVELPAETDLNHYFEIMNTRGRQLERRDVLKAQLMGKLKTTRDRKTFSVIWNACADMDRRVQLGFDVKKRDAIFGDDWCDLKMRSFDELAEHLFGDENEEGAATEDHLVSLSGILSSDGDLGEADNDDEWEDEADFERSRDHTILSFENFLLQALYAHVVERDLASGELAESPVALDDKKLLPEFNKALSKGDEEKDVKDFAEDLLRARWLFDSFIIRSSTTNENDTPEGVTQEFTLKYGHKTVSGSNKRKLSPKNTFGGDDDKSGPDSSEMGCQGHLVILQAMFQVTDSRHQYKAFVRELLKKLFEMTCHDEASIADVDGNELIDVLEQYARRRLRDDFEKDRIENAGVGVSHLALNYLDYLLWQEARDELPSGDLSERAREVWQAAYGLDKNKATKGYRFAYRASVEHFFPRNPIEIDGEIPKLHDQASNLNALGNLCLMTRSGNSRRGNLMPKAKVAAYDTKAKSVQTIKFQIMADIAKREGWEDAQIEAHGEACVRLLRDAIWG